MDTTFFLFVIAGFLAQMIDGCIGMAYGVSSTSLCSALACRPQPQAHRYIVQKFLPLSFRAFHYSLKNIDKNCSHPWLSRVLSAESQERSY